MKRQLKNIFTFLLISSAFFFSFSAKKNDIDINTLKSKQKKILSKIESKAINEDYDPKKIEPIEDGICNFEEFKKNKYRIMWILKEGYDDFDQE